MIPAISRDPRGKNTLPLQIDSHMSNVVAPLETVP